MVLHFQDLEGIRNHYPGYCVPNPQPKSETLCPESFCTAKAKAQGPKSTLEQNSKYTPCT